MRDWLWHLFNDPMRDNPRSIVALVVIVAAALVVMFYAGEFGRRAMLGIRRRKQEKMDDRAQAQDAIDRARHDRPDEEGSISRSPTDIDYGAAQGMTASGAVISGERLYYGGTAPSTTADTLITDTAPPVAGRMPDPVTDSGVHTIQAADDREACPHCRGKGYVMTTNDLLRESIALVGDGGDVIVREFYTRLLHAAPDLAQLFPADLLTGHLGDDSKGGAEQRDKLLQALVALSQTYDPTDAEKMRVLDTHLLAFGRAHAAFQRPDGSIQGATLAEYEAVKSVLFGTLVDAAGPAWLPEYTAAWSEAYEHAARGMIAGQYAFLIERAGYVHPRQPRA